MKSVTVTSTVIKTKFVRYCKTMKSSNVQQSLFHKEQITVFFLVILQIARIKLKHIS